MEVDRETLAHALAIRRALEASAEAGPTCRVEHAAQVAELANSHRKHDPLVKSTDFLDGYTEGVERASGLIRMMGAR